MKRPTDIVDSLVAGHLGAAVAVVDVGANLDHSRGAGVVC